MLEDCEAGHIDLILTKSISRFARNMADCVCVVRRLTQLGVGVHFERENIFTLNRQGELFLCVMAALAQEESSSLRRHMCWSHRQRNAVGKPFTVAPYGYRYMKETRGWQVQEAQARRVRLAFEMASQGKCYREIRAALNALEAQEGTGRDWNQYALRRMLINVSYTGDCLTNKTMTLETEAGSKRVVNRGREDQFYIEEHHPALVARETYALVQRMIDNGRLHSRRSCRKGE